MAISQQVSLSSCFFLQASQSELRSSLGTVHTFCPLASMWSLTVSWPVARHLRQRCVLCRQHPAGDHVHDAPRLLGPSQCCGTLRLI